MGRNELSEDLSDISEVIKNYLNTRIDLIKLQMLQKIAKVSTYLLTFISILVSLFAVTIFLMFSFSNWYGEKTGMISVGFLISAGFFLLLLLLVYLLRKYIFTRNIIKIFARILFSDDEK